MYLLSRGLLWLVALPSFQSPSQMTLRPPLLTPTPSPVAPVAAVTPHPKLSGLKQHNLLSCTLWVRCLTQVSLCYIQRSAGLRSSRSSRARIIALYFQVQRLPCAWLVAPFHLRSQEWPTESFLLRDTDSSSLFHI